MSAGARPAPYRILITGSRDWGNGSVLAAALGDAASAGLAQCGSVAVVHGGCPSGADLIADYLARQDGLAVEAWPADWKAFGRAAGPRRNTEMVAAGADACLVFAMPCSSPRCMLPGPHDSHGTADCAGKAEAAGIPVRRYSSAPR